MTERRPCDGVIDRIRQIGNRRGWIVLGDDDATTITSWPDESVEWPLLLRPGDRVTIIRANPARNYPGAWIGKLAGLHEQPEPTRADLSVRLSAINKRNPRR